MPWSGPYTGPPTQPPTQSAGASLGSIVGGFLNEISGGPIGVDRPTRGQAWTGGVAGSPVKIIVILAIAAVAAYWVMK